MPRGRSELGGSEMSDQAKASTGEAFPPKDAPTLLHRFARFWDRARGDGLAPNFTDMDPVEMPWALQSIFVIERRADRRLTYRLVGGLMSDRLGGGLIGKTAGEVFEARYAARVNARWNRVMDEPALCFAVSRHLTRAGHALQARRFLAPARSTSGEIDRVIGVCAFDQEHLETGSGFDSGNEIDVRWWSLGRPAVGAM